MGLAAWSGSRPAGAACERPVRLVMARLQAAWFGPSERAEGRLAVPPNRRLPWNRRSRGLSPEVPSRPSAPTAATPSAWMCRH